MYDLHIFIFIYFTIIGHITNSQLTFGFESRSSLNFFQVVFLTAYVDSTLRGSNFTHVLSAVHMYDFHILHIHIFHYRLNLTIYPCGLVAQWIEHCTGIAKSWVRILFKLEFFSGCFFQLLKLIAHCENQISLTEIILFFLYYLKTSRISVVVVKRRHHEKWPIGENAIEVKRE